MTGVINTLAFAGRRGQQTSQPRRKPGGTRTERVNPRYRKGAKSGPTGMDEGSRSNAQYRGAGDSPARTRGEPRPKGPTIKAARQREGNAGHDVCAKERQEGL